MYSMFLTPLTCCSIGAATEASTVVASAPGKLADTTTEGGVIGGKRAIGNCVSAIAPASVMMMDSTVAKIGRSMKKLTTALALRRRRRGRGLRRRVGDDRSRL